MIYTNEMFDTLCEEKTNITCRHNQNIIFQQKPC